jgi:hypothetical protein
MPIERSGKRTIDRRSLVLVQGDVMRWSNMAATTTTIPATMNTVSPCRAESFLGRWLYWHRRRHLSAIDKRHRGVRRIQSSKELASQQRSGSDENWVN